MANSTAVTVGKASPPSQRAAAVFPQRLPERLPRTGDFAVAILIIGQNRGMDASPNHIFLKHKLAQLINPLRAESRRAELFMCTDAVLPRVSSHLNATAWHVASGNATCGNVRGHRCNAMFLRARGCFEFADGWARARGFAFDWYVRDRPDTVLMRPAPPLACLPDQSAVYAPPRWAGQQAFPTLCSPEKQRARQERIRGTSIGSWSNRGGNAVHAYRESCSNGFTLGGNNPWKAPMDCLTISDEFAMVPAKHARAYFTDTWFGMSEDRETPPWGRNPGADATTKAHCCMFMNCHALLRPKQCTTCAKWAPEGVLTRQLFMAGAPIGVLELDTAHVPQAPNQRHQRGGANNEPLWRWLRSDAATSLRHRDAHCKATYEVDYSAVVASTQPQPQQQWNGTRRRH